MPEQTAGELTEKIQAARARARSASLDRQMKEFRQDSMSEVELALASFNDGFNAGYAVGYRAAIDIFLGAIRNQAVALHSGIMSSLR